MARTPALTLLALALIVGAGLRFYRLDTAELTADEAASWAGATAPGLRAVIERQRELDPGKLALYDLTLHGWIGLNGDGVGSMRALSAAFGTLAIALVFVATRELLLDLGGRAWIDRAELAAALAALIAAVNLTLVDQARTVRMYPLTLALELAQIICFLRALSTRAERASRVASLVGIAVFSALAIASNFTASLLIAAETIWLGWVALRGSRLRPAGASERLHRLYPALALGAGIALLAPMAPMAGRTSIAVVHAGVLDWAHLRPPWWPLQMMRNASGKAPFLILLPLAIYATYAMSAAHEGTRMPRDHNRAALGFALCWMLVPIALVMAVSYAFTPFEEMRYVISSVVAFFVLAGIGLAAIDDGRLRLALLVLVVALSLDHIRREFIKPQYVRWREATALALAANVSGGTIAVMPAYAVNVVRYYLPRKKWASVEPAGEQCEPRQRVMILSGEEVLTPARLTALRDCAPLVIGRLPLVEVRKR